MTCPIVIQLSGAKLELEPAYGIQTQEDFYHLTQTQGSFPLLVPEIETE